VLPIRLISTSVLNTIRSSSSKFSTSARPPRQKMTITNGAPFRLCSNPSSRIPFTRLLPDSKTRLRVVPLRSLPHLASRDLATIKPAIKCPELERFKCMSPLLPNCGSHWVSPIIACRCATASTVPSVDETVLPIVMTNHSPSFSMLLEEIKPSNRSNVFWNRTMVAEPKVPNVQRSG